MCNVSNVKNENSSTMDTLHEKSLDMMRFKPILRSHVKVKVIQIAFLVDSRSKVQGSHPKQEIYFSKDSLNRTYFNLTKHNTNYTLV